VKKDKGGVGLDKCKGKLGEMGLVEQSLKTKVSEGHRH